MPTLDTCPKADALAFGAMKGDLALELLGSPMGERPDKLMFKALSGRDVGTMMKKF